MCYRVQNILFFPFIFLNVDISFNLKDRLLRFCCGCYWHNNGGNLVSDFLFRP